MVSDSGLCLPQPVTTTSISTQPGNALPCRTLYGIVKFPCR